MAGGRRVPGGRGDANAYQGPIAVFQCPPRLYGVTVIVAEFDVTPPEVAVTLAVPTMAAVASPVDEMLATELGVDVQVETLVTSPIELSV